MSANTYAGNASNYPTAIHKVENGDPPVGGTFQTAIAELADRTAYLKATYEHVYVYTAGPASQTYALNLTGIPGIYGVEFTIVGGGQAGGNASGSDHGHGGASGAVNTVFIPILTETAYSGGFLNLSIRVGAGGAQGATVGAVVGPYGFPTYVQNANTSEIFLFAPGGGYTDQDTTSYPGVAGWPYIPPPAKIAPFGPTINNYIDPTTKLAQHSVIQGTTAGFAMRGGMSGGAMGLVAGPVNASGGRGAGAGGGGGILTSGSTAANTQGTGGHGGYPIFSYAAQIGTSATTTAAALGGLGAGGCAVVRVFYRP